MKCRPGCPACCSVISISSAIPGMPKGKPPGIKCINLTEENLCRIYYSDERPEVCKNIKPSFEMCGTDNEHAIDYLNRLENLTKPN
jgi:Fe-S-cluster containining protein